MSYADRGCDKLSIVYSCSGCSGAAQIANEVALRLDHNGEAEMSCIAGVGGDVVPLVRLAKSGRSIIAIDGCPLACVRHCLKRHDIFPSKHYVLSDYGVPKDAPQNPDPNDVERIYQVIQQEIGAKPNEGL